MVARLFWEQEVGSSSLPSPTELKEKKMKRIILLIIVIVVGLLAYVIIQQKSQALTEEPKFATVKIAGQQSSKQFQVEFARTATEQQVGLSGRDSIDEDQGMLFVIDPPEQTGFWMYKMRFPIDIVWISNNTVVGTTLNLPMAGSYTPPDQLPVYYPPTEIDYALELKAGAGNDFVVGDNFQINQ